MIEIRAGLLFAVLLALAGCKDYSKLVPKHPDAGPEELRPAPADATLLATGQNAPTDLRIVGGTLFWRNQGGRPVGEPGVFSMPASGGKVTMLTPEATDDLAGIAADADGVYWLAPREGKIVKVPRGGGEPQALADSNGISRGMTADATDIYWAENGAVYSVPKAGGKARTVAPTDFPDDIQTDDGFVYWYSTISGVLSRAPKAGKRASKVYADDKHTLHAFVIDGNDLFVVYGAENKMVIQRLPTGGGKPVTLAEGQPSGVDFAVDADNFYWITDDDVWAMPRAGGEPRKVVAKLMHGTSVAVDDQYVYWADRTRIQKMAKK